MPLEPWSVHDIRRSVATGLQRLGVRLEVTEAVLNHVSGSRGGIAGVYQRHDWAAEKRAALDAWASHVPTVSENKIPANKNRSACKNICLTGPGARRLRKRSSKEALTSAGAERPFRERKKIKIERRAGTHKVI